MCIYIYIYIVDSNIILSQRGGIFISMGNSPTSLSQAMLVGIMLVGRVGLYNVVVHKAVICYILHHIVLHNSYHIVSCRVTQMHVIV